MGNGNPVHASAALIHGCATEAVSSVQQRPNFAKKLLPQACAKTGGGMAIELTLS